MCYWLLSTYIRYIRDIEDSSHTEIKNHRSICYTYTSCVERDIRSDFTTISSAYLVAYILTTKISTGLSYPICPLPHNIAVFRVSMYLSKGSPLLNPINQIIRRLSESGLADRFFRDYRNVSMKEVWSLIDIKKRYAQNADNYITFSLSHLHLAFVSFLPGSGLILSFFSVKLLTQNLRSDAFFWQKFNLLCLSFQDPRLTVCTVRLDV